MIRLYNLATGWLGRQIQDSQDIPAGLVKLQVVINDAPAINTELQYLQRHEAIDVDALTWTVSYTVHDYTEQQITDRRNAQADAMEQELNLPLLKGFLRSNIELTQENIDELLSIYPVWKVGMTFTQEDITNGDNIIRYGDELYTVIQPHTTQFDWKVDELPALYTRIRITVEPWVQPAGTHDAYQIGDRVTHNGFVWENTSADNVFEPGVFGWNQIEPI